MFGTGASLYAATVPFTPTILGPSLWLDEDFGVALSGSTISAWTCKATGKTAVPSPQGFTMENGNITSYFGMGMSFPATQAQTICIVMRSNGFPTEDPSSGKASAILGDDPSSSNRDYIFLNNHTYEISIDGRVSRSGLYQRNALPPVSGTNIGTATIPVNTTHSLLIRYPTQPNSWKILGAFLGSSATPYGSQTTWHQVMMFDRMLNDTEATQLLNWTNSRYSTT